MALAANTDPLTGLLNRRGLDEQFNVELSRARRQERAVSVLVGDVDGLKTLNDTYGHASGDQALQRVAAVLLEEKRATDIAARLGGDEFAILAPDTDAEGASTLAHRLAERVRAAFAGGPVRLSISIGAATTPTDGESADELLHVADEALYAEKRRAKTGAGHALDGSPNT